MFRILTLYLAVFVFSGAGWSAVYLPDDYFSNCVTVDADNDTMIDRLDCSIRSAGDTGAEVPFGWSDHGIFGNHVHQTTGNVQQAGALVQTTTNRYNDGGLTQIDGSFQRFVLEGIYMLLLDARSVRPAWQSGFTDNDDSGMFVDNDNGAFCDDVIMHDIYETRTTGEAQLLPVRFSCADNDNKWAGEQWFYFSPDGEKNQLVITLTADSSQDVDNDNKIFSIEATGYDEGSIITSIMWGVRQ